MTNQTHPCPPPCSGFDDCRHPGEHEVDGELYCSICAAGLVRMAMAALGQLPHIRDTESAPEMGGAS